MTRILAITWKDLLTNFRDRNALILMIVAPLVLSAIIGASFGNFLSNNSATPFDPIPVLLVNADEGEMGHLFADGLAGIEDVLAVTEMDDLAAARQQVQRGEARALVYLPPGFSTAVQSTENESAAQTVVQFYADPSATITPNIVRGIVAQLANSFNGGSVSAQVALTQLTSHSAALGPAMLSLGPTLETAIAAQFGGETAGAIALNSISVGEPAESTTISPLAFFAPSMGLLFLMFAMMDTTRSILDEEQSGTLPRLLTTPIRRGELLFGKVGGVFFSGIVQFVVFVIASRLLFQLNWGRSTVGLALMVLAIVSAYTGLGLLIAAFAKDVSQAAIVGSVVSLLFAALGGNFVAAQNFPPWLEQLSKITINRWGLDGLMELTIYGGGYQDILLEAGVLLGLGMLFFALALWLFNRRISR